MHQRFLKQLIHAYNANLSRPFSGTLRDWAYDNLTLPASFAMPGKVDIYASKYLIQPAQDLLNPKIRQVNLIGAVQTGKSWLTEIYIPYLILNNPGNVIRLHQHDDAAKFFNRTRLLPILNSCKAISDILSNDRYSTKQNGVHFPHMEIRCVGQSELNLHGVSCKYLICDEAHLYEAGTLAKAMARTNAFAQNRKIVICSQPNTMDSELYRYCASGNIYEWHWQCPQCQQYQKYEYTHKRNDNSYSGLNWETILNADGETTNIGLSARTAYMECYYCRHKITDTPSNRRQLNDNSKYICTKNDGDSAVVTYMWSGFVNMGLSFEYFANQGMNARKLYKNTGLDTDWVTFINQVYGRFYKQEVTVEQSKIVVTDHEDAKNTNGVRIMTVDVQRKGSLKYYVIREYDKDGKSSRKLDHGVCTNWDDVAKKQNEYNIQYPCVGIDSGDGESTVEVYQESVKHGKVITLANGQKHWASWICLKGDQKLNYLHKDGIIRLFKEETKADPQFAANEKFKGIPAKLYLWAANPIRTILANLRDNKITGVKWTINKRDPEYEQQMYSEGLMEVVNKKTGIIEYRWVQRNEMNHYWDCEAMNLAMAIMFNLFSPSEYIDEKLVAAISKSDVQTTNIEKAA